MRIIHCDICKKKVEDPIPGRDFFFMREYEICEECRDDLDYAVKHTIRKKKPFDFQWFDKLRFELLAEGQRKNKIPGNRPTNR